MCLLLLAFQTHPETPLLLAGNRDEFFARPSAPPGVIAENPRIFAGQDLEEGGTWLGYNEHGLTAALTNRRRGDFPDPTNPRSRGTLLRELLGLRGVDEALGMLHGASLDRYRPFNLLFGDARRFFFVASWEGAGPKPLPPGFHVLSNSTLNDTTWDKVARSQEFLQKHGELPAEALIHALQGFLCDTTPPQGADNTAPHGALGAVFVETPAYGTVSAAIITQGGPLGSRYYYADAAHMRSARSLLPTKPPIAFSADTTPFRLMRFS